MDYRAPLRDMRFLLFDVFGAEALWQRLGLAELGRELADSVLDEAAHITERLIAPLNLPGHEEGVRWHDGAVSTPKGFPEAWRTWAQGGWVGLSASPEHGGQGLPKTLTVLVEEMLQSANNSFCLYSILTSGAILTLETHAPQWIRERYLPRLVSGEWTGTMCLTEAHAGTDLGIMRTRAEPQADGSYRISGSKIFITGGEQDLTPNIVHLVLARLPDAPAGTRGISLFLVPKFMVAEDGRLGPRNGAHCARTEHKMGINASATCVMNFDGATGYLIGEPHKGLAAMFTMMNYERLTVGIQGLGCAEAAYQKALHYARERLQSRAPGGPVAPERPADPIIALPDVRRMLLTQKTWVEGMRAMAVYVAGLLDQSKYASGTERERAQQQVALFTPVAKAFITDRGFDSCVLAQQCFGGHGYIREWGVEQLVRDARIGQIYEGTNGVQAYDLVARKVLPNGGAWVGDFLQELRGFTAGNASEFNPALEAAAGELEALTRLLVERSAAEPALPGAAAVDYLDAFGLVACGYFWLRMLAVARGELLAGKRAGARFFFERLLPRLQLHAAAIRAGSAGLMGVADDAF